jgi:hypothetical protein
MMAKVWDSTALLPAEEAYAIANQFALASSAVLEFRVSHLDTLSRAQALLLEKCEDELDANVVAYRNQGIMLLGTGSESAVAELKDATARATKFLKKLDNINKAIEVAVGIVDLTRAILAHDVGGVAKATKAVAKLALHGKETDAKTKNA